MVGLPGPQGEPGTAPAAPAGPGPPTNATRAGAYTGLVPRMPSAWGTQIQAPSAWAPASVVGGGVAQGASSTQVQPQGSLQTQRPSR